MRPQLPQNRPGTRPRASGSSLCAEHRPDHARPRPPWEDLAAVTRPRTCGLGFPPRAAESSKISLPSRFGRAGVVNDTRVGEGKRRWGATQLVERSSDAGAALPSLAAVLPLKVTGRHYAHNLARLDVQLSSLLHYAEPGLLDDFVIVTPPAEMRIARDFAANWPELPIRVLDEAEYFEPFSRYRRPWQMRPWQRQQVIKLNSPSLTNADYVLILDPDVIVRRPVSRDVLFPGGRALLPLEPRSVHPGWWRNSASLLRVPLDLNAIGIGATPAILSNRILLALHKRLEECGGKPWMDVLLTSYCDWTEYTLYLLAADYLGLLKQHHIWVGEESGQAVTPLQVESELSIWTREAATESGLRKLLSDPDPGIFGVVQSNTELPPDILESVASAYFPVRRTAIPEGDFPKAPPKSHERLVTFSRLAASQIYSARRRLRER